MPRSIRPDGSLDPAADFEDEGASFRVRREAQLREQFMPVDRWSWRYLFSAPKNGSEAVGQGFRFLLKLVGYCVLFLIGAFGMIGLLAALNIIH